MWVPVPKDQTLSSPLLRTLCTSRIGLVALADTTTCSGDYRMAVAAVGTLLLWVSSSATALPHRNFTFLRVNSSPSQVAQLVGASSCTPKGCGLDSHTRHIPRTWVWSLIREHKGGNWSVFLSYRCFSLSPSTTCSLSLKEKIISLGEDSKKKSQFYPIFYFSFVLVKFLKFKY